MQYNVDRSKMPRKIVDWTQVHPTQYAKPWYTLMWTAPNQEIGSCRVSPLRDIECQSKSLVIQALKLAYASTWTIRSFDDALEVIRGQGLRLLLCTPKGPYGRMTVEYQTIV